MTADMWKLIGGLAFPEELRWRDGLLWFADIGSWVVAIDEDGCIRREFDLGLRPAGIGWLADGRMLVVNPTNEFIVSLDPWAQPERGRARPELFADLRRHAAGANGLVVTPADTVIVGVTGSRLDHAGQRPPGKLLVLSSAGEVMSETGEALGFPNGIALSADGRRLAVPETFGARVSSYDIGDDGMPRNWQVLADLPGVYPDGAGFDTDGALWVASATEARCLKIASDGRLAGEVHAPLRTYACAVGGAKNDTLFVATAPDHTERARLDRQGTIYAARLSQA